MSAIEAGRFFNVLTPTTDENIICLKVQWMICDDVRHYKLKDFIFLLLSLILQFC